MSKSVLDFWNDRAKLSEMAGTNDITAKRLEMKTLAKYFSDGLLVAEFGCGNGLSAFELVKQFNIEIHAYDFSSEMIKQAKVLAKELGITKNIVFDVADITNPPEIKEKFDLIFTERMIINLPDWEAQLKAIKTMSNYLKIGGRLLLMENSQTGLDELNSYRAEVGLETINAPWHNLYLDDNKVNTASVPNCELVEVVPYSATYYFISRVVNAWQAKQEGKEPSYDAPINSIAENLPAIGTQAQGKIWIWQKIS